MSQVKMHRKFFCEKSWWGNTAREAQFDLRDPAVAQYEKKTFARKRQRQMHDQHILTTKADF